MNTNDNINAIINNWKKRPLSWSSISSFEYEKAQWFDKYILGKVEQPNALMEFGKRFAEANEKRQPLAPVMLHTHCEFKLSGVFGGIPLIGFIDTYEPGKVVIDHKTGSKEWTQKRADDHRQLDMYLFMLYLLYQVDPEQIECAIEWVPTKENNDFTVSIVEPVKVHRFNTKRTRVDILNFGAYIKKVYKEMEDYSRTRLTETCKGV